jgi:hypothetical protein
MSHEHLASDPNEESRRRSDIKLLMAGGVYETYGVNISPEIAAHLERERDLGAMATPLLVEIPESQRQTEELVEVKAPVRADEASHDRLLVMHDAELARLNGNSIENLSNQESRLDAVRDRLQGIAEPYAPLFSDFTKMDAPTKDEYLERRAAKARGMLWYRKEQQNPTYAKMKSEINRNGQAVKLLYEADMKADSSGDKVLKKMTITGEASDGSVPEIQLHYENGAIRTINYIIGNTLDLSQAYDNGKPSQTTPAGLINGLGRTSDFFADDKNVKQLVNKDTKIVVHEARPEASGEVTIELGDNPKLVIRRTDKVPYVDHDGFLRILTEVHHYKQVYSYDKLTGEFVGANDGEDDIPPRLTDRLAPDEVAQILSNLFEAVPTTELR